MDDMPTVLLLIIGACLAAAAVCALARHGHEQPLVPVIQRRNELRQELEELLGDDGAAALLREVAARERRPSFELEVLEKAVARAKSIARQRADAASAPAAPKVLVPRTVDTGPHHPVTASRSDRLNRQAQILEGETQWHRPRTS
ncbi:MAG: hypothetical protein HZA63_14065 [Rhodocyclales bacterium]|nr:hypothetical protein [Rhodocyclales bacterium]